jgi:hypothetical protein
MSPLTPCPDSDSVRPAEPDPVYFVGAAYQPEDAAVHARIMAWLRQASPAAVFQSAVAAGIYSPDGRLLPPYADDEVDEPEASLDASAAARMGT